MPSLTCQAPTTSDRFSESPERKLGSMAGGVFLAICVGFAVPQLEFFRNSGILLDELPAALAALLLSSSLLPLAAVALAPWSLAKIRHC